MQSSMAVSAYLCYPLCQLEVITACSFCVAFGCHSVSEVMKDHVIEKKEVNNLSESENYSGGGNESNYKPMESFNN
jgi:hypothetical protein